MYSSPGRARSGFTSLIWSTGQIVPTLKPEEKNIKDKNVIYLRFKPFANLMYAEKGGTG